MKRYWPSLLAAPVFGAAIYVWFEVVPELLTAGLILIVGMYALTRSLGMPRRWR